LWALAQVEYNRSFRLYLQTRLQNPHYRPEVSLALTSGKRIDGELPVLRA